MTTTLPAPTLPSPPSSSRRRALIAPRAALGTILVTGGASGLGAATVAAVRAAGGSPLVLDRTSPTEDVPYHQVDLADSAAAEAAVAEIVAANGGRLDGVFTAAGIDSCGPLDGVSAADWERVIRVNLIGTAAVVRAALPHLRRSSGRVVTCASTLGIKAVGRRHRVLRLEVRRGGLHPGAGGRDRRGGRRHPAHPRRHAHPLLRRPHRAVQATAPTPS